MLKLTYKSWTFFDQKKLKFNWWNKAVDDKGIKKIWINDKWWWLCYVSYTLYISAKLMFSLQSWALETTLSLNTNLDDCNLKLLSMLVNFWSEIEKEQIKSSNICP